MVKIAQVLTQTSGSSLKASSGSSSIDSLYGRKNSDAFYNKGTRGTINLQDTISEAERNSNKQRLNTDIDHKGDANFAIGVANRTTHLSRKHDRRFDENEKERSHMRTYA